MHSEEEEKIYDSEDETSSQENEVSMEYETTDWKDEVKFKFTFEVLSTDQVMQTMNKTINEVHEIVKIPSTLLRILLNHFNWDLSKFYDRYYGGDQRSLFEDAHVVNPLENLQPPINGTNERPSIERCEICFLEFPSNIMTGIGCGHRFCQECWKEYLTSKIMHDGMSDKISCPASECDILVDYQTVMNLIEEEKVKQRYRQLIINSYVAYKDKLRWCPFPDCNNVIRVQSVESRPVTCNCSHTFCFGCGESCHEPFNCDLLRKWKKKCDDSETYNWLKINTKECPKCFSVIEKNGGCNHMICSNPNCRTHFCWICLGPWQSHKDYYKCNQFKEEDSAALDEQEKSRAAYNKYLFYSVRYMNHLQSQKLEKKLNDTVETKIKEMSKQNVAWVDSNKLRQCLDVLCQCRQTLMYSYAFAYYLKKNNQCIIFEENQRDLETATEKISEYLERDLSVKENSSIINMRSHTLMYSEEEENIYDSEDETSSQEDEVSMEFEITGSEDEAKFKFTFDVLSTDQVMEIMNQTINELYETVKIPPTFLRILLNHFNWDLAKFYDRYYGGDQRSLFENAHMVNPLENLRPLINGTNERPSIERCEICFLEFPSNIMTGIGCGHRFCQECWKEYLTSKIMHDGMSDKISCPASECDILVDYQTVMNLIEEEKVKQKYQQLIINSYVAYKDKLRWCPFPDCNNVIRVQSVESRPVTCNCSHTFCFGCGESCHEPVNCDLLRKWKKKCSDDSETYNWLKINTKECPKCFF
ncbi:ARIH1, partial [Cordylochernes scorpioides]